MGFGGLLGQQVEAAGYAQGLLALHPLGQLLLDLEEAFGGG